jgi:hypothetical protein
MRRRSRNPAPISVTPIAIATGTSNPVNGSLPVAVVAAVVPVELELTVPVEPVDPVDDETVPELLEPDEPEELEPELEEPLEPLPLFPLLPLSGSTYCWSPADEPPPLASAATGASSPKASATSSERSVILRKLTARVLQASRRAAFSQRSVGPHAARPPGRMRPGQGRACPPLIRNPQMAILQDLLQG